MRGHNRENKMVLVRWIDRIISQGLRILTITCFVFVTILVSANVFVRFVPVASLHWFDEIIELLYAYLVFYGAAALWITREHFSVGNWIGNKMIHNVSARHLYRLVLEVIVLIFALIFFYYSFRLTALAQDVTNVFAIPKRVLYSCMPIAGAIMIIYSIRNVIVEFSPLFKRNREGEASDRMVLDPARKP
jgi:TRAP-type C4-dicarboxylate transport system permease small subunit